MAKTMSKKVDPIKGTPTDDLTIGYLTDDGKKKRVDLNTRWQNVDGTPTMFTGLVNETHKVVNFSMTLAGHVDPKVLFIGEDRFDEIENVPLSENGWRLTAEGEVSGRVKNPDEHSGNLAMFDLTVDRDIPSDDGGFAARIRLTFAHRDDQTTTLTVNGRAVSMERRGRAKVIIEGEDADDLDF